MVAVLRAPIEPVAQEESEDGIYTQIKLSAIRVSWQWCNRCEQVHLSSLLDLEANTVRSETC